MRALTPPIAMVLLLCLPIPTPAAEFDAGLATSDSQQLIHELRLGVMAHDISGLLSTNHKEPGVNSGMEVVFNRKLAELYSGVIRPNLGFTWNSRRETSKVYAGLVSHWNPARRVSLELGFGLTLHNGERESRDPNKKELGSRLLFRSVIELGLEVAERQQISIYFDHISNAGLATKNQGMDLLGMRWGRKF